MHRYREKWRLRLQKDLGPEGWGDVIRSQERVGIFANWKRNWDPGGTAEHYLRSAVEILCGDPHHPYAQTFLNYASQIVERAYEETERWQPTGDWGNPEGLVGSIRGSLLRAKAITEAITKNAQPEARLLTEAAAFILTDCREARGPKWWTELEQSSFLSAVQLLLIAGDITAAKDMFNWRKSFKRTQIYHDWLKQFTLAIPDDGNPVDDEMRTHFDAFFDVVRDPDWVSPKGKDSGYNILADHTILRLQLALIKRRFILGAPVAGHWDDVIDLIAQ
jgi:hypothetical protein